jgi:chromosome segregation ATPase
LTRATITERDVMSALDAIESRLEEQPDFQLLDQDTTSFLESENMGTTSTDMFSDVYSVYIEPRFPTHEDAQNALYTAADSLCPSITYYKTRTASLKPTSTALELCQQEAERKAEEAASEIDNLRREKDALEQTLAEKQRAEVTWMAAKLSAEKDAERLQDKKKELRRRMEEMTNPDQQLEVKVARLKAESSSKSAVIATM